MLLCFSFLTFHSFFYFFNAHSSFNILFVTCIFLYYILLFLQPLHSSSFLFLSSSLYTNHQNSLPATTPSQLPSSPTPNVTMLRYSTDRPVNLEKLNDFIYAKSIILAYFASISLRLSDSTFLKHFSRHVMCLNDLILIKPQF